MMINPFEDEEDKKVKFDWSLPVYKLDHSRVIDNTQKDLSTYSRKFELWDKAVKGFIDEEKIKLLNDPGLWLYAMFGIRLRWYQDMIAGDDYRFKIFCGANQVLGKSYTLNCMAIYSFLKDWGYGFNRAIISYSLPQAKYQMQRIKNILKKPQILNDGYTFDWESDKGDVDNIQMISLNHYHPPTGKYKGLPKSKRYKYTNHLICAPCTEGALGFDLHAIDLDEFDWWGVKSNVSPKEFFYQVAQSRTLETKGRVNIYSNPNGKKGTMYEFWNQKMPGDGSYKWHRYRFNYWDSDKGSQDDFDKLTLGMSRSQIQSVFLSEFAEGEGSYFTDEEITSSECKTLTEIDGMGKQTFWMLDVGSVHDQCVLGGGYIEPDNNNDMLVHLYIFKIHVYPVGYPLSRVVGIWTPDQVSDGWHYETSVKEHLSVYAQGGINPVFGCDVTGNSGIVPLFNAAGVFPIDVVFSGPVKSGMYQTLKYMMEKHLVHRIPSTEFDSQFTKLRMDTTERGYMKIHHETEDDRDDVCFIGDTLILTDKGQVPIKDIKTGDMVKTRKGYFPVIGLSNRETEVITKFGLTGTPNHPFITKQGIVKFKNLNVFHQLYLWNEKQSSIEEKSIIDILHQREGSYEFIIGNILTGIMLRLHCIDRFGLIITGLYKKVMLSITRTVIHLIILFQILNVSRKAFICLTMQKNQRISRRQRLTYRNLRYLKQRSGIVLKKDLNGIKNMLRFLWLRYLIKSMNVLGVKRNIFLRKQIPLFVQPDVMKNIDGQSGKPRERVYNLKISQYHEYFANNILVHNCDSVAGLVYLTSGYNIQSGGLTVIDSKGKIYSSKDSDVIRGMKDDHAKDVKDKQVIGTGIQTLKQYLRNQRLNGY